MSTSLALDIRNLCFAYPDGIPVIDGLSWELPEGAFALVTGANASGKSTLLRLLVPSLVPAGTLTGTRHVCGRELAEWSAREAAEGIGFVAQRPENQIACDSVRGELALGLESVGTPPDEMRRRIAGVAHFLGITPLMRRRTASLSGGETQAVAVASALAQLPRILLLDEPASRLDPIAERNLLHLLFRVNRELGITVVMCTHQPETCVDYATCGFELADGRLRPLDLEGLRAEAIAPVPAERGARRAGTDRGEQVVIADDLSFRYERTGPWALRGADLAVARGEICALVGANGSGKSTLLQLVARTLRPQRGRVRNAAARSQALLPQNPKMLLACDSVEEELREWQRSAGYDDAAVAATLERTHLADRRATHPFDLSGGQQQILALAKLALTRPQLLLLDEPTQGLDPTARVEMAHELLRLARAGTTIILATHDLALASRVADRVALLFDGEVACQQPTADFFADNLFYQVREDAFTRAFDAGRDHD